MGGPGGPSSSSLIKPRLRSRTFASGYNENVPGCLANAGVAGTHTLASRESLRSKQTYEEKKKKFEKSRLKVRCYAHVQIKATSRHRFAVLTKPEQTNKQNPARIIDSGLIFVFPTFSATFFVNTPALIVVLKY